MERSRLTLVGEATPAAGATGRPRPAVPLATGALVLLVAGAATVLDADRARHPIESREIARRTILQAIELGADDPTVRDAMLTLRRELGRRPMDAYTRAVYATFVVGVSRGPRDAAAAAFHARRAAAIAPVTVPVVRYATHVLARTGEPRAAADLVREMSAYDPQAAATLLGEVEALLPGGEALAVLAETPEAWLAWWGSLRSMRRHDEADALLARARERWPDDPEVLLRAAQRAHGEGRWEDLAALFPPGRELPAGPQAARLHGYRARARAVAGDGSGARADAATAAAMAAEDPLPLQLAGETLERLGDAEGARRHWTRALFLLSRRGADPLRVGIMVRLARLEEREGSPATALRTWRSILELEPEHVEARRRVDALAGFQR